MDDIKKELNNAYKLLGAVIALLPVYFLAVRACIRGIYQGLDQQKEE